MKTKIGTSFGLALLLALGVLATMLALGMFTTSKAKADVDVSGIILAKTTPGDNTQVTIFFSHATILTAGSGQILVTFDATWGVPTTIKKEHVTLTTFQATGGTSNPTIDPSVVVGANSTVVTLTIGDTAPAVADSQNMFPQGASTVLPGSPHILVFSPLAGITNPVSQGTEVTSWICVTTSQEALSEPTVPATSTGGVACPTTGDYAPVYNNFTTGSTTGYLIPRSVSLSATSGANGTSITVTGKGYLTGTLTAFLDLGVAGVFVSGTDTVLGTSAAAVSGGTGTVTLTASLPTFTAGANLINMLDGNGAVDATPATFTLLGAVSTNKTQVKRGESLTVTLSQYGAGTVTEMFIGGVGTTLPAGVTLVAGTALNLAVTVPTTTPLGTQRIAVTTTDGSNASRNTTIEVIGAPLTLSPATAVPLQTITVSGTGFVLSGTIATIFVGTEQIVAANINNGVALPTDSSGNFVSQVKIPLLVTTNTAGTYTLTVTDSAGRTGSGSLTVPSRTITLNPTEGKRGSTVTVTGSGFPAAGSVTITYFAATNTVASASPDSTGAFTTTFTVPTDAINAVIPSTNTVLGTSSQTSATVATAPSKSASHKVDSAAISLSKASAASGESVVITGVGFPGFGTLATLTIGTVNAIPVPAPATDVNGSISVTALVPALALGTQAVLVTIGGTSANTSLTIVAAPVVPVVAAPVATGTVFASVISNADNLVRVWRYNNATQAWAFYDPRPAFAAANTLTTTGADIVWVNVKVQQTFQGQTLFAGWNLVKLN